MYLHLTSGTEDFLAKVKNKNLNANMILASNVQKSILYYCSSEKKSIFQMPQTFEIINQTTRDNPKKMVSLHRFHMDKDNSCTIEFHVKSIYEEIIQRYAPSQSFLLIEKKQKSLMIQFIWSEKLTYKLFQGSSMYENLLKIKEHYSTKDEAFFTPYMEQSFTIIE